MRAILARLIGTLTLLASALVPTAPAQVAEPPTAIIIFDGSGSMWGRLDGERVSKLVLARDAVRTGLALAGPGARVGLMSFGHRRSGDCGDVESIVKPDGASSDRVVTALEKLNPRGRGPITLALREAAKEVGTAAGPQTVVLIHDDTDNCQADPCAALPELRRLAPRLRVDVVSLGMKPDEARRMSCLARETDGRAYEVQSAAQATAALSEIVRTAFSASQGKGARAAPPTAAAAGPDASPEAMPAGPSRAPAAQNVALAGGEAGLKLTALLAQGGPAVEVPVHWRVTRVGGGPGDPYWEDDAVAPLLSVPTGRWRIEARLGFVSAETTAEAVKGEPRAASVTFNAGVVQLAPPRHVPTRLQRDLVLTFTRVESATGEIVAVQRGLVPELALPPGQYTATLAAGSLRIERPVALKAGERVSLDAALAVGALELSATLGPGGPAAEAVVYTVSEDDPDQPKGRREIARSAAPHPSFRLPVGTYYVVARQGTAEARDRIGIKPGETDRRTLVLDAGRLTLATRVAGTKGEVAEPVSVRIERIGNEAKDVSWGRQATQTFDLAAGRYRVESRIGLANARLEREVELKPGAREQIVMEHQAGSVRLKLLDSAGTAPVPEVAWEIRDPSGQLAWAGTETEAQALLLAGRYRVKAQTRDRTVERLVDVRAGEARSFDISPR